MKRYNSIELLRFLTSISVLLYHYRHFYYPLNFLSDQNYSTLKNDLPFSFVASLFYEFGFYGVHVFYTISGFVFAYVYLSSTKASSFKQYSVNRFARLYPLHFITLIYVASFQILYMIDYGNFQLGYINDLYHFFLQIFFISAWGFENGNSFNAPIWSVSVEIGIYILFFLLLNIIKKYNLLFLIIFSIILIIIDKSEIFQTLFIECARLFFSGIIIYYIYERFIAKKILFFLSSFLLLFLAFIGNFKTYVFCPGILMMFLSFENNIKSFQIKNIFTKLGNMTYSLYLMHVPVQLTLILLLNKLNISFDVFGSGYFFFFYFILLFVISQTIFIFYEKPLNNSIRKFFLKKN